MNDKIRAILGIALGAVSVAVPGASPAVALGQQILTSDHPDADLKNPDTAVDAAEAAFQVVENLKGVDIGNEVQFRVGCALVEQGLKTIHAALQDHTDGTPSA